MGSRSSAPAPPGKSMRSTPAESSPSVPRTLAGLPLCSSTHWRISSWSVVVVVSDAIAYLLTGAGVVPTDARSEEHTSELQSRGHLVCRLLLEKKNKRQCQNHIRLT